MTEEWRDILGYEGLYMVSNCGRVKSLNYLHTGKAKELKPGNCRGYKHFILSKNGKTKSFQAHRLVWEAFNGPIPKGMQVNHINEDKMDNRLFNLNLMTQKENTNWGTRNERAAKSNGKMIIQYDLEGNIIKDDWISAGQAAKELKLHQPSITACCKGRLKTTGGFIWKYAE